MNQKINFIFKQNLDQLINNTSESKSNVSEREAKEYELCVKYIMNQQNVDRQHAIEIYNMIAFEEVKETVDQLVKEGLLQISGYNQSGEPKFRLTELGKQCAIEIKKQEKSKKYKKKI